MTKECSAPPAVESTAEDFPPAIEDADAKPEEDGAGAPVEIATDEPAPAAEKAAPAADDDSIHIGPFAGQKLVMHLSCAGAL